tara:strand:+ start:192 stop:1298 length:1107 start_codon:yes stop_codon:yes gene_type:complete
MIIAAKYGGPCAKCGEQIKAGRFVNWGRDRGIWHLNETDNKELGHVENGCRPNAGGLSPDANHKEDKTMDFEENIVDPNGNDDRINVSDLIKALQGMVGEVAVPEARRESPLTSKQISFCELMALGSSRADAYTNSYDVSNPAFSNNAARKLLRLEKIRNKIAELNVELRGGDGALEGTPTVATPLQPWVRAERGWTVRLTDRQEKFCQARAGGATLVEAFKKSGYRIDNFTERRIRKEANKLIGLQKVKDRIADLTSGHASDIEVVTIEASIPKTARAEQTFSLSPAQMKLVEPISDPDLAELTEFVDNFVELIKAHGRLFHHAVVIRGQKAVGLPVETTVKGMEEAVGRSIETLRETLNEKLQGRG